MDTRTVNGTHYGGALTAGVDSSHGIRLSGGSTGGVIEAVGDDANVSIFVRGKGTGAVTLGNSSQAVNFGGSTASVLSLRRVRVDFTIPTMAVNAGAEQGDIAVSGLTTNAVITIAPRGPLNSSVAGVLVQSYCSTAGQLHLTYQNAGTTITGSTMSAYAMIHEFNVPA
jgi:hypothetical protein